MQPHARRRFFVLADVAAKACGRPPVLAPLALTAVERIDAIFAIEREINGLDLAARLAARRERLVPLVARALRGVAPGRKACLFAGSGRSGERAAVVVTLIQTARLNGVDPQAWLAEVLARINEHPVRDLDALLPWN